MQPNTLNRPQHLFRLAKTFAVGLALTSTLAASAVTPEDPETAARAVMVAFLESFNNRDAEGWADTLQFPHVRLASGTVTVYADGLILHTIHDESLRGPVNATSPNPVTNASFTSALGRALGRPTVLPVPGIAVKAAFGELGKEMLLWGQRVIPRKALDSGFEFFHEGVEESLRFELGRVDD